MQWEMLWEDSNVLYTTMFYVYGSFMLLILKTRSFSVGKITKILMLDF